MINLTIVGRIVKDAETRVVKVKGVDTFVTDFTLAANDGYGENRTVQYFKMSIWRDHGARMCPSLKKSRILAVKGGVKANPWKDKDGNARATLEVTAPIVEFIDKKPEDPDEIPVAGDITVEEVDENGEPLA